MAETSFLGASNTEVSSQQPNDSNLTSKSPLKSLYSNVLNSAKLPTKEEAIVLDSIDGLSIHSYTVAIGKIIEPKNILFASRISQNRVCMYLSSKVFVDKLVNTGTKVKIENNILEVRRLISRTTRVIISNACPIIPHHVFEEELNNEGIKPASKITYIRGGNKQPGYEHICSFRRQVYIKSEDVDKLPPSVKINFDDTDYWVYFSKDKVQCFLCKEEGHIAKFCKAGESQQEISINSEVSKIGDDEFLQLSPVQLEESQASSENSEKLPNVNNSMPPPSTKRTRAASMSSASSTQNKADIMDVFTSQEKVKSANKKKKLESKPPNINAISASVTAANSSLDEEKRLQESDLEKISKFLVECYKVRKVREIATKHTDNIENFSVNLSTIGQNLSDSKLKSRITRVLKRMEKAGAHDDDDSMSDSPSVGDTGN